MTETIHNIPGLLGYRQKFHLEGLSAPIRPSPSYLHDAPNCIHPSILRFSRILPRLQLVSHLQALPRIEEVS